MRYPLASRTSAGLFWWVVDAQRAWRDLTRAQRTALLAVDSGLPTKPAVVARLDDKGLTVGRQGAGAELNPGYWNDAVSYLKAEEAKRSAPTLFDLLDDMGAAS